ncbi:MAG: serine protease [Bacillota bacterium]
MSTEESINERRALLETISQLRNSDVILYVTGDRKNMGTQIAGDVVGIFNKHLESFENPKRITLILYTLGGNTLAAWNIVNMIREYCQYFEVIVLNKARSAGTLISLGANTIIMNNLSTLGPIDPSLTGPFNPVLPNTNPPIQIPISVEDVKGYVEFAKNEMNIKRGKEFKEIYSKLSDKINPLVIGSIYRSKEQIKMLAKKLLNMHFSGYKYFKKKKIISFLCSDSGSHDYTINKKEAIQLGLPIEVIKDGLNEPLALLLKNIVEDLMLDNDYDPIREISANNNTTLKYLYKRGIVESINGGTWLFVSEGELRVVPVQNRAPMLDDRRSSEGWRKLK